MKLSRREMLAMSAGLLGSLAASPLWASAARTDASGKRILRVAVSGLPINGTLATLREQSNVGRRTLPSITEPIIDTDVLGDLSLRPAWPSPGHESAIACLK